MSMNRPLVLAGLLIALVAGPLSLARAQDPYDPETIATVGRFTGCALNVSRECFHVQNESVPYTIVNTPGGQMYQACLDNAQGVRSFRCRCTLTLYSCIEKYAKCASEDGRALCKEFIRRQNEGCSVSLCRSASSRLLSFLPALAVAVLLALLL